MGEAGEMMVKANQNQCPFNIITSIRQKKTCLIPHPDRQVFTNRFRPDTVYLTGTFFTLVMLHLFQSDLEKT